MNSGFIMPETVHQRASDWRSSFRIAFAPSLGAIENSGMSNLKCSGNRSTAQSPISQSAHPQINFLPNGLGVSAQVFDGFGLQKWRDFTPRRQVGQFKEAALPSKPSSSLVLLSQKVAANGEQNHLFGKIHTSAMGGWNGSAKIE